MGGDDNRCDSGLLGVTSNNIPQTEQHSPLIRAHAALSGKCNYYVHYYMWNHFAYQLVVNQQ